MHKDNLTPEGKILSDTLCSDLEQKKNKILTGITSNSTGGKLKKTKHVNLGKTTLTKKYTRRRSKRKISRRVRKTRN